MDVEFARRYVNDGFSGGEMKRAEILQLAMLQPKFADPGRNRQRSGCRRGAAGQRVIADIGHQKMGLLIITHHDKLLEHNPPEFTHVMLGGRIVETGGKELAEELHQHGYDRIRKAYPEAEAANQEMLAEEAAVAVRLQLIEHDQSLETIERQEINMATDVTDKRRRTDRRNQQVQLPHRNHGRLQSREGIERGNRQSDLGHEERTRLDARVSARSRWRSSSRSRCPSGAARSTSISRTSTTTSSRPIIRARPGTMCRRKSRTRSTSWAFPKPKRSSWPA